MTSMVGKTCALCLAVMLIGNWGRTDPLPTIADPLELATEFRVLNGLLGREFTNACVCGDTTTVTKLLAVDPRLAEMPIVSRQESLRHIATPITLAIRTRQYDVLDVLLGFIGSSNYCQTAECRGEFPLILMEEEGQTRSGHGYWSEALDARDERSLEILVRHGVWVNDLGSIGAAYAQGHTNIVVQVVEEVTRRWDKQERLKMFAGVLARQGLTKLASNILDRTSQDANSVGRRGQSGSTNQDQRVPQ